MVFKQSRLDFEERVLKDMLQEWANDWVDRHETGERWERREMNRMKVFMKFSINEMVSAGRKASEKDW